MSKITKFVITEIGVVIVAVALIATTYVVVIPKYFTGIHKYSILFAGLTLAAIAAGLIARKLGVSIQAPGWFFTFGIVVIVVVLTLFFSLGISVSFLGS